MNWDVYVYYDLDGARDQWDAFFAATPTSSLNMTWQYADVWWKHFGADRVPYIITVTDEYHEGLMLPLMKEGRNLLWLGAPDTNSVSLLYNASRKLPEAVRALGDHLRQTSWSRLSLPNLHRSQVELLISAFHPMQHQIQRETISPSILVNQVPWEEYHLSAKLRADIRRKYRQLESEGRVVRFDTLRDPNSVHEYFPLIKEIASREGHELDGKCGEFLRDLWHTYAGCGWLELNLCYFDVTPVAYSLIYTINGATSVVSSGSVPKYQAYAPEKLLMEYVLENSFKRGDYLFDLQPEPDDTKRQWTDEYQPLTDLTFYQNHLQRHFIDGQEKIRRILKV